MRWFNSVLEIKQANHTAGQHFFDKDTMRFFRSRIHDAVYGGRFFVTSECGPSDVRGYTVREADDRGWIETVGEFEQYASRSGAHGAAKRAAEQKDGIS